MKVRQCVILPESIEVNKLSEKKERKAYLDCALELYEQSLQLFEQNEDKRIERATIHTRIGTIYGVMGELDHAIFHWNLLWRICTWKIHLRAAVTVLSIMWWIDSFSWDCHKLGI